MDPIGQLHAGDGDALVRLIADAYHDEPGPDLPWALLDGLADLLGRDTLVTYTSYAPGQLRWDHEQVVLDAGEHWSTTETEYDEPDGWFSEWWTHPLCSYPQRTGDLTSIVTTTDFVATADEDDARRRWFGDIRTHMILSLPAAPGVVRRVLLARREWPGFDERDRQVVALLRPHVQEIWLDAERRRAGVPELTSREWEVLALVGSGLSHAEIAARLVVAVSTVRKHLEHVRERMGVHSAAAAASIALPHAPTVLRPRAR
ncbi:helix-turn-helix transcriptional regulator [Cellulomonas xylanilytica]|uniref:helix-turn-helix transcriptional regulator n=1 Tax=Cellulomonas xylanilytica TaxID=233583 RepID=UPI001FE9CCB8|nr:helix-turn-helix transcriptional regulator [Cellulomonas xylanilytica]